MSLLFMPDTSNLHQRYIPDHLGAFQFAPPLPNVIKSARKIYE